ncbi:Homocysteine S-methyltransferase [Chytridium lagenaria]|nr:Homocysteine S-methyltransferase [Chytridium lagenaria]
MACKADVIITSSYQASVPGLKKLDFSDDQILEVFDRSTDLARQAVEEYNKRHGLRESGPYVAASLGSYGAYLANGSEYTGAFNASDDALVNFHLDRMRILARGRPDLFAFETIPSLQEARCIAEAIFRFERDEKPIESWVSFSCASPTTVGSGDEIAEIASSALGVSKKALVCYVWRSGHDGDHGSVVQYLKMAQEWREAGATGIGGCCRTGPEHIHGIFRSFRSTTEK